MKNDQIVSRDTRPNAHPSHTMGRNQLTFERTDVLGQSSCFFFLQRRQPKQKYF